MSQIINTNVLSLNAQRNLASSQGALAQSLERLSSGLRINSAKDDAAGLAISERFTTQIRGINQAVRNANDGISLSQTGEAALATVTDNLQRIRELAVQSANATNSDADRATLQQEVDQRLSEIDRIANQTSFNGRNILDGSFGNALFQVGADVGQTIELDLDSSVRISDVGALAEAESVDLADAFADGEGSQATLAFDITGSDLIGDFTDASAAVTTGSVDLTTLNTDPSGDLDFDTNSATFDVTFGETTAQVSLDGDYGDNDEGTALGDLVNAIQAGIDATFDGVAEDGATFTVDLDDDNQIRITADQAGAGSIVVDNFEDADGTGGGTAASNLFGTPDVEAGTDDDRTSFTITDPAGNEVVVDLDTVIADGGDLETAINAALDGEFTVAAVGNDITLTNDENLDGEFAISADPDGLFDDIDLTSTAGETDGVSIEITDLTIQFGDNDPIEVANDTYTSQQAFVDAINTALGSNGTAALDADTNVITITSGEDITIGGADAGTVFTDTEFETEGALGNVSVASVAGSNDTIQRTDAALTSVSDLRSTFGAIQNRFESTIENLTTTVENLSASRSRIRDADFASETADLTRAQILQQAGTSVLAQANAVPQNVLALLQ